MTTTNIIADVRVVDSEQFCVRIGDEIRTGDLYYLGIDPRTTDHNCSPAEGLKRLLHGWMDAVLSSRIGQIFHLPFDFSDECTRWVACERDEVEITVVFGWADVEGWSFSPSDFAELSRSLTGFHLDEPTNPQSFYTPRFLSNLRRCIAHVRDPD